MDLALKRTGFQHKLMFVVGSLAWMTACGGGSMTPAPQVQQQADAQVRIMNSIVGPLRLTMSTSFQPAEWDYQFFNLNPGAPTTLGNLLPQHVRLQGVSHGVPQTSPTAWDFSTLDAITQPVLSVGDHSPEFQIAVAPSFMYDANGNLLDPTYLQFAAYSQNLVRYYDTGGFSAPDGFHVSPSPYHITWWGIFNEPNFNNVDSVEYTRMYNAVVPAMQAVDPSLKFAAVELGDYSGLAQTYLPTFVNGVNAHVDVLATHFYSTCNQSDNDTKIFSTVPGFASEVQEIQSLLKTNPSLASVPVWVTENNVNADYSNSQGNSTCNPSQKFVPDRRGSSAFFAAWRPYVFSQFGKVGVEALYHWDFDADAQYGEVNYNDDSPQLSYWVDYWLARMFPSPPGANILQSNNSDQAEIEVLPGQNPDGSVVIMISNHAVKGASDNDGTGAQRTVSVDVSAFGSFHSGSLLTIDASTNAATGPTATTITPAAQINVDLKGYGVAFLTLK